MDTDKNTNKAGGNYVDKSTPMFVILFLLFSFPSMALEVALNNTLASPVLDAKQAYSEGNLDLVGIQLDDGVILPGIKQEEQAKTRKQHSVRPLNRHWRTLKNAGRDSRELYSLKRYANRYNLTMMKLIKSKKLEQQRRYRY